MSDFENGISTGDDEQVTSATQWSPYFDGTCPFFYLCLLFGSEVVIHPCLELHAAVMAETGAAVNRGPNWLR